MDKRDPISTRKKERAFSHQELAAKRGIALGGTSLARRTIGSTPLLRFVSGYWPDIHVSHSKMTPNVKADSHLLPEEPLLGDLPTRNSLKDSVAYAQRHSMEDLHPAFTDGGFRYDENNDRFIAELGEVYDEATLFDGQRAFADALEQFQQGVKPKYKSQIDLCAVHTWDEVIQYAEEARRKYTGVGGKGITKKIGHGLKIFQTAAPAIQAWLKLLPSTTWYGSILCGGLIIVLEVCSSSWALSE